MLFACIFVPDFPAAAIVRAEPELRGASVAVVEGTPPLLHVVAANEGARQAGVEAGMTKLQAEARLVSSPTRQRSTGAAHPHNLGIVRRRSLPQEQAARAALGDCARGISPRVEQPGEAPDTVLLDISGLQRLFGTPRAIAVELARRAAEVGLEANVAVCSNLDAAICAARGFAGVTVIEQNAIAQRLAPLGIDVLLESAAIESAAARDLLETFDRWGVRTCRAFATLPEIAVAERLGTEGVRLQMLARGEGTRTFTPTEPVAEFEEAIELEYPIEDLESLAFVLNRLIEQLCARLSTRALSTNELNLRMKLEARSQDNAGLQWPDGQMARWPDHADHPITQSPDLPNQYARAIRLPVPMLDAKTILRLWQLELRGAPPGSPVEKMWLRAEAVEPRFTQNGLFLPTAPEPERLEITLSRIASVVRAKNGNGAEQMRVGMAEVLDTHAPDAFRMKRFVATTQSKQQKPASASQGRNANTAIRRLRPPVPVSVEMREGRPVRVRGAQGLDGGITWHAGPWRISGNWWNDTWARDEWDVAVETASGQVFYLMYRDTTGSWFVGGTYD